MQQRARTPEESYGCWGEEHDMDNNTGHKDGPKPGRKDGRDPSTGPRVFEGSKARLGLLKGEKKKNQGPQSWTEGQ